jgi:hypothetical protein
MGPWRHAAVTSDLRRKERLGKSTWPGLVAPLLRSPDLGYVPIAFRGVCDRACAVAEAAIEDGLLDMLPVLVHFDHVGLGGEAGRPHVDPAEILTTHLQDLLADITSGGHAYGVDESLVKVEAEQVAVVLTGLAQCGVVRFEAKDRAVVCHPNQQGPALPAVQERCDGLEAGCLERSEELPRLRSGAQRGFVLQVRVLLRRAEKYAFPVALVILAVAFGTLVAAGVPILIGDVSVLTALAALYFLAGVDDMSVYVLSIATMLGLGIDYALFAVSRFREELETYPIPGAVSRTVATAGRSIYFSGLAVLIGLSGLLFFPFMFIRSIGVAGVVVVFVSVCGALTLLPAVLGVLGVLEDQVRLRINLHQRPSLLSQQTRRQPLAFEVRVYGVVAEAL